MKPLQQLDLREVALQFQEKLKKIKIALFDVDGIMTDSRVFWSGEEVGYNRFFNTQDGYGLKVLKRAGLKVGIITGGSSVGVKNRFSDLGVDFLYMGNEDKREAWKDILDITGALEEEILYMGDEFFDLPLLKRAGFSATAPHASIEIRQCVDYVSHRQGGDGCVREVIDLVRHAQSITPDVGEL
jgi:3-deoxy-D-manno-octulosonate 8-phosphate phosphatase (KDO 8-P phosphatase)